MQMHPATAYFPKDVLDENLDHWSWYAETLHDLDEPTLFDAHGPDQESYRFFRLGGFWAPLVLRAQSRDGERFLAVKLVSKIQRLHLDRVFELSPQQWEHVQEQFRQPSLWQPPVGDPPGDFPFDLDGVWLVEASKGRCYQVFERQAFGEYVGEDTVVDAAIRELCIRVLGRPSLNRLLEEIQ